MAYEEFIQFVEDEMRKRHWNKARLAKESGITLSHISRVLSRERTPGATTCLGIARAFHLPPEDILRRAGLVPPTRSSDSGEDELQYLYRQLDQQHRHYLLLVARALVEDASATAEKEIS